MNTAELRNKSPQELQEELHGLLRERFNLLMQKASGQMSQSHQLRRVRRDVARIKTVMSQQQTSSQSS